MQEQRVVVGLDWKPSVRRRHEARLRDPNQFGEELSLLGLRPDMFDDGVRMDHIEFIVLKGKLSTVGLHKTCGGIGGFERAEVQ